MKSFLANLLLSGALRVILNKFINIEALCLISINAKFASQVLISYFKGEYYWRILLKITQSGLKRSWIVGKNWKEQKLVI